MNSKYLNIIKLDPLPNRKTCTYIVKSKSDMILGNISWYSAWRKYCFYPLGATIWDTKCLTELISIIDTINIEYKRK